MVTVYNDDVPTENQPATLPAAPAPATPPAADMPVKPFYETSSFGTFCGFVSAVAYLAANTCLRSLTDLDSVWVSAIKAVPTVLLMAPWLAFRASRGWPVKPTKEALIALVCAGLIGQLGGNISFQWCLGVVGLALAVPLCMAGQIIGSALLGRAFLSETVSFRMAIAVTLLIAATAILSLGAKDANQAVAKEKEKATPVVVALGVVAATAAGFAYAALGVIIRRNLSADVTVSTSLFTICLVGAIVLGAIGFARIGLSGILAISARDNYIMFLGGAFNALAFLSLTKALQLIPVVQANALGATQAALAALAGVFVFSEPLSNTMLIGVALTAVGLLSMKKGKS